MTGALVMVILHFSGLLSLVKVLTTAAKACTKFAESYAGSHPTNAFHLMHMHLSNIDMNSNYRY